MARIMWNVAGQRTFEAGVDRGVLYLKDAEGVPWNGLVAVSESPTGGDVTPYYIDGIKYLNHVALEEFEATIEAYTYPDEFLQCDGTRSVRNGLFATQQPKHEFGLAYRTLVGNDLEETEFAYKIHLVYNATASPTERANNTLGETTDPFNFSWHIVTKPPTFIGLRPTAHFVIDSRETPSDLLRQIEDILYGSADTPPRLPSVPELLFIFQEYDPSYFDAGVVGDEYYLTFDGGYIPEAQETSIDAGGP